MRTFHEIVHRAKLLSLIDNMEWRYIYVKQELWKATGQYFNL